MKSESGCGIGAEYPKHHIIQLLFIIIFTLFWLLDSFFFGLYIKWFTSALIDVIRVAGFVLFFSFAYIFIKKSSIVVKPETYDSEILVKDGIYAKVRHPMYLGIILVYLSIVFLTFSLTMFLVWVGIFIIHDIMVSYEENDLIRIFKEKYLAYRQEVPKWLPKLE